MKDMKKQKQTDGRTDGQKDRRTDGQMGIWTDGLTSPSSISTSEHAGWSLATDM